MNFPSTINFTRISEISSFCPGWVSTERVNSKLSPFTVCGDRDLKFVLKQNSDGALQEAVYFSSSMEPALMAWVLHRGQCTEFLVLGCDSFYVGGGRGEEGVGAHFWLM